MKFRMVMVVLALAVLSVSCAHKSVDVKKTDEATVAQKVENKKDVVTKGDALTYYCKVHKDIRQVNVEKAAGRCEVFYTKYGEREQVAWAEATPTLCGDVSQKIRKNIEGAGFLCAEDVNALKAQEETPRKTASKEEFKAQK
jgi:hypothetical protein